MAWAQLAEGSPKKPFFLSFYVFKGHRKHYRIKEEIFGPRNISPLEKYIRLRAKKDVDERIF